VTSLMGLYEVSVVGLEVASGLQFLEFFFFG